MDFVFTTANSSSSMCNPFAWTAKTLGHNITALQVKNVEGHINVYTEDPGQALPVNPFAYGHTGLVEAISKGVVDGWRVDWVPQVYDRELWLNQLGDLMWNKYAKILSLADALSVWKSGRMHLCPSGADSGPKAFKGLLCERGDLDFLLPRAAKGRVLDPSIRVALSELNLPDKEWRCVFIGGEWVAAGLYLDRGVLRCERGAPNHIESFAKEVAKVWVPGDFCVMDIAQSVEGDLGVVEFNSLHSSGLYDLDRSKVVCAINNGWAHNPKMDKGSRRTLL